MHDEGLQSAEVFGISGPLWRTWDIICAQWLLARTLGHAVGARHWLTQGDYSKFAVLQLSCHFLLVLTPHTPLGGSACLNTVAVELCNTVDSICVHCKPLVLHLSITKPHPMLRTTLPRCGACAVITNTVFPAACLYYFWTASGALPMKTIMHTLVAVMLTTLAAKLLVEGVHTVPKYCKAKGTTTLGECSIGLLSCPPAKQHVTCMCCCNGMFAMVQCQKCLRVEQHVCTTVFLLKYCVVLEVDHMLCCNCPPCFAGMT